MKQIDLNELAQHIGYDSMRQYMALNYYLPVRFLTFIEIAEDFGISEGVIRQWMKRENLPAREKGHPRTRGGFYCERCTVLTSFRYIWYYRVSDKFICDKCMKELQADGEWQRNFWKPKKGKGGYRSKANQLKREEEAANEQT